MFPEKYTFVETKSLENYQLDQMLISFEVGFDQTSVKVTAYNEKSKKQVHHTINNTCREYE
ncbi:SpaA isopeptide-forming pilin-related protein, partial [Enterococcus faecalis]|uniref:SpaA isopeptide-forming pilin-related protein n=1 Tax=Enterococcus faecalis TaxID=1351 RepID=UPI003D7FBC71